jgi:hypothetical protein
VAIELLVSLLLLGMLLGDGIAKGTFWVALLAACLATVATFFVMVGGGRAEDDDEWEDCEDEDDDDSDDDGGEEVPVPIEVRHVN